MILCETAQSRIFSNGCTFCLMLFMFVYSVYASENSKRNLKEELVVKAAKQYVQDNFYWKKGYKLESIEFWSSTDSWYLTFACLGERIIVDCDVYLLAEDKQPILFQYMGP